MKLKLQLLLFLFGLFSFSCEAQKLKRAFNGKNLNGWEVPSPNNDNWTVSDGLLHVKNSEDKKGSILWTSKHYKDFIVEVEYKNISGVVDSGIFLRSEKDQIQIGISGSLKRDLTGSPYIPGRAYPKEAQLGNSLKPFDWNKMRVMVIGNQYTVWLNGTEVLTFTSENMSEHGPIGLQLHPGNTMAIDYRNIKIAAL